MRIRTFELLAKTQFLYGAYKIMLTNNLYIIIYNVDKKLV